MNAQERVLDAIEKMINEFGSLRNDGVVADMWYKHVHEARSALWKAYYAQRDIVTKQKEV